MPQGNLRIIIYQEFGKKIYLLSPSDLINIVACPMKAGIV
jgi:hypothetical protein